MGKVNINYRYTKGLLPVVCQLNKQVAQASPVILWLMILTGFNRVFTKNDMNEFLLMMAILLEIFGLYENWMNNDELWYYRIRNKKYSFGFLQFDLSTFVVALPDRSMC